MGNELLQGIVAGAIVTILVLLCCFFYWCKIRKRKSEQRQIQSDVSDVERQDHPDGKPPLRYVDKKRDQQEKRKKLQKLLAEPPDWENQLAHVPQHPLRQGPYKEIDLHNYSFKRAMDIFELFLAVSLNDYQVSRLLQDRFLDIITGRGKHSKDGIPVIKMAISDYLLKGGYGHTWPNPGKVRIDLDTTLDSTDGQSPRQISCQIM